MQYIILALALFLITALPARADFEAGTAAAKAGDYAKAYAEFQPLAIQGADRMPYYRVRIATERDFFERHGNRYRLVPGVQVLCSIRTGQRSVLAYLTDPFLRSMSTALRER